MSDISYFTQEGFDRVNAELDDLKTNKRREISLAIAEAREKGDLSENAEYHAAKDAQGLLEAKINSMELALANARVIDKSQLDDSRVTVLSVVTLKNLKNNKEVAYQLVAPSEADLKTKRISVESPIGKGLLGKEVGDVVEIQTPAALMKFEVLNISLA